MSEEEIYKRSFIDEHPANYDQQVELAKEIIGRSNAWVLLASEPFDEETNQINGMFAVAPGADMMGFLSTATETFAAIVKDAFEEMKKMNEDGPAPE